MSGLKARTAAILGSFRVETLHEGIRGVLETLNVRVHHAIVRRARSKIIEPNFANTANFDKSLPAWCGHKPTERPERFAELLEKHDRWVKGEVEETPFETITQIAWLYGEFLRTDLNERDHTGEGMQKITPTGRGWMCPNECWEKLIGSVPRRWAAPEVIQFWFHKRRESTVRNGEIRVTFSSKPYHYRIAGEPTKLMALNGEPVEISYDQHDLEKVAVYRGGCFIGFAENVELRKMGEQQFVEDERNRRASRREVKAFTRDVHKAIHIPSAQERALRRIEVTPARREPQRAVIACVVPGGVQDAIQALDEDRSFTKSEVQLEVHHPHPEPDDDTFNFFS